MAERIQSNEVEECVRSVLTTEGFALSKARSNGETGVDILAEKANEQIHIEIIGYKESGPARAKDFFEVFFRAISRLKDGAKRCVIAMPDVRRGGLRQRAEHYGKAWTRLGKAFPELEIWLVDLAARQVSKSNWNDWEAT